MAAVEQATHERDVIIAWVEQRNGHAARVTGAHPDAADDTDVETGALRIGFPGYASEEQLEPISWDDFFEAFSSSTFYYYETEPDGTRSHRYRIAAG
ncbi:MAG: hypothetical protein AAF787_09030 [Chloroflexota bacterium]